LDTHTSTNKYVQYQIGDKVVLFVYMDGISYYTGTLLDVSPSELVLSDVAWVRSAGDHSAFLNGEKPKEAFSYGGIVVFERHSVRLCAALPKGG